MGINLETSMLKRMEGVTCRITDQEQIDAMRALLDAREKELVRTKKQCTKCLETLPLRNFSVNRTTRDGLNHRCRVCSNSRKRRSTKKGTFAEAYRDCWGDC